MFEVLSRIFLLINFFLFESSKNIKFYTNFKQIVVKKSIRKIERFMKEYVKNLLKYQMCIKSIAKLQKAQEVPQKSIDKNFIHSL